MKPRALRACIAVSSSTVIAVGIAACGGGSSNDTATDAAKTAQAASFSLPKGVTCESTEVGPVTRCENFYKDYWPTIDKNLDALYKKAMKADGGKLVIWDWYALNKRTIAAFTRRFPGLKVQTKGLNFNLASAILSAKASGARNSDTVKGSLTSASSLIDGGMIAKVDWTKFGVPKEYLEAAGADSGLLPDSINGTLLQYNSAKAPDVPRDWNDLTKPAWRNKLAITNYNAQCFTGYGIKHGKKKMVELIHQLKKSGNLTVTNSTGQLLSSGDKPVVIAGQLFDDNPDLKVLAPKDNNLYLQFTGVNTDAENVPGAMLYALWNAFDPQWVKARLTDKNFASAPQVFPGLPTKTISQATGMQKVNMTAWVSSLQDPSTTLETMGNRKKFLDLINAANDALKK